MNDLRWEREQKKLGMVTLGTISLSGGLWLVNPRAIKMAVSSEREAAALLLALVVSLLLAGFPAGWVAGGHARETFLPLWLAMAGAYLVPMLAWFAGFSPEWPISWVVAFALVFAGSWAGLGVGLLLARRRA